MFLEKALCSKRVSQFCIWMLSFNTNNYKRHKPYRQKFCTSHLYNVKKQVLNLLDPKAKNQCGGFVTKSCQTLAIPWTVARKALLSMGFSRQEHQSGLPCPPLGDLPDPGIKPASLKSPTLEGRFFTTSATWEAPKCPVFAVIFEECLLGSLSHHRRCLQAIWGNLEPFCHCAQTFRSGEMC